MLESENIGIQQVLRDSGKWIKNFRTNILTNWFQLFTSFSKFSRKIFKQKNFLPKYRNMREEFFSKKKSTKFVELLNFEKKGPNFDLILLYFLNILKLVIHIEKDLFPLIS